MNASLVSFRFWRKGRRRGWSTTGGHGHICLRLFVIYYARLQQQSVGFKEIGNEKFLIAKAQCPGPSLASPRLVSPRPSITLGRHQ